jgi:hypothetical protein
MGGDNKPPSLSYQMGQGQRFEGTDEAHEAAAVECSVL